MITIVTDSTAYIQKAYAESNRIKVLKILLDFDGLVVREGFPGEFEQYYTLLEKSKEFPKTSQPPIGEFVEIFQKEMDAGNEVIAIMVSSKTSGTYNTALMASHMVNGDAISVIDSETSGANLKVLVERANELAKDGKSREDIIKIIEIEKKRMSVNMTFETLDYIEKAGRLTHSKKIIVDLLHIKPIVGVEDGFIKIVGRARGKNQAIKHMIKDIHPDAKIINVCYIMNPEEATEIKEKIESLFPHAIVDIQEVGPSLGIMFGPRAIGILCAW